MKRINLIPPEAKKTNTGARINAWLSRDRHSSKIIIATLVFFAFLFIWHSTAILRYRLNIVAKKEKIKTLEVQLREANISYKQIKERKEQMNREKKRLEQRLYFLQEAGKERIEWSKALARLSSLVPEELWIGKASFNKDVITITGTTIDNTLVSNFMSRLDESKYFQGTGFNYTQKAKLSDQSLVNFEVTTHLSLGKFTLLDSKHPTE